MLMESQRVRMRRTRIYRDIGHRKGRYWARKFQGFHFPLGLFLELPRSDLSCYFVRNQPQIVAKSRARKIEYVDTFSESTSDSDESMTSGSEKTDSAEAQE